MKAVPRLIARVRVPRSQRLRPDPGRRAPLTSDDLRRVLFSASKLDAEIARRERELVELLRNDVVSAPLALAEPPALEGHRRSWLALLLTASGAVAVGTTWLWGDTAGSALFTVALAMVAFGRHASQPEQLLAPVMVGSTSSVQDAQFTDALLRCRDRSQYRLALNTFEELSLAGHGPSRYALAVLSAVSDVGDSRALELFRDLRDNPTHHSRASLGYALLALPLSARVCATLLAELAESHRPTSKSEIRAWQCARRLSALVDESGNVAGHPERGDVIGAAFARSVRLHGELAKARHPERVRRELTSTVARLIALVLPLDGVHGLRMLPVDIQPVADAHKGWRRLVQAVPVLNSARPGMDPYPFPFVTAVAKFLWARGLRGITPAVLNFVAFGAGAVLVADGRFRWAAVALLVGVGLDTVDGRVAQMTSRDVGVGLFIDYVLDRMSDVALGLGFAWYFLQDRGASVEVLTAAVFVAACTLASYVRAEAERFELTGHGGPIERPHRMAVTLAGLVAGSPEAALYLATACALCTVTVRFVRAAATPHRRPIDNLAHWSQVTPQSREPEPHAEATEESADVGA